MTMLFISAKISLPKVLNNFLEVQYVVFMIPLRFNASEPLVEGTSNLHLMLAPNQTLIPTFPVIATSKEIKLIKIIAKVKLLLKL